MICEVPDRTALSLEYPLLDRKWYVPLGRQVREDAGVACRADLEVRPAMRARVEVSGT